MAFREKFAWLSLVAMIACYGTYFVISDSRPVPEAGTLDSVSQVWLFGFCAVAHGAIVGLGQFLLGKRQKADERDRDIERRSMTTGYWVLLLAMMLVGVVYSLVETGWEVANAAILAIVVAELVREGVAIWHYRRGYA